MAEAIGVESRPRAVTGAPAASELGQWSWALFEWARNPYVILVTIYLFAPYFTTHVVGDPVQGQIVWGATAMILGEFACLFDDGHRPPAPA